MGLLLGKRQDLVTEMLLTAPKMLDKLIDRDHDIKKCCPPRPLQHQLPLHQACLEGSFMLICSILNSVHGLSFATGLYFLLL